MIFGKPVVKVLKKIDRTGLMSQAIQRLQKQDVLVGIPQAETARENEPVTNAELAYLHTNGSPLQGIPARPFLQPAIKANVDKIGKLQVKIIHNALNGEVSQVPSGLERVGIFSSSAAKAWFTNPQNGWAPNAPYTIAQKGSDKPLIDTGALRQAITYVVRETR